MLVLTPVVAAAQSSPDIPRTAWGDPDIGGVWDYSSITPMQRPEKYGDREFLTAEEVAELEAGAIKRDKDAAEAPPTRSEAGDKAGANGHSFVYVCRIAASVSENDSWALTPNMHRRRFHFLDPTKRGDYLAAGLPPASGARSGALLGRFFVVIQDCI